MGEEIKRLFAKNRAWADRVRAEDPGFFDRLACLQAPQFLWIGCSDSRVPANEIAGLLPGEVFVHRNIANVVVHTDLNCLSVIQFAVDVLKVRHIMVVGHYGCGGVRAALENTRLGLADNWVRHVQDVRDKYHEFLGGIPDVGVRWQRLCELNAVEQALNVARTTIVQDAWARGQELTVHGWVYDLADGLLRDLDFAVSRSEDVESTADRALALIRNA
ncbi:MAG: carbonate dehydratase [Rhodocyclales bacterium]|nr:carbonate dehydratase [Rhodocyclales bacterium]